MTAAEAKKQGVALLGGFSSSPELDVSVLLSNLLGVGRSALAAHPELEMGSLETRFFELIERRRLGVPVAYLTGVKEFWALPFHVTPDVLIPKPDTEILVERAIDLLKRFTSTRGIPAQAGGQLPAQALDHSPAQAAGPIHVLDVCTGSGCIAISLKHACPRVHATATDISEAALAVARHNATALLGNPEAVTFLHGDLRDGLPPCRRAQPPDSTSPVLSTEGWSLIVSNPPYVPTKQAQALLLDGRSEPLLALDGGTDGLDLVKPLVRHAFGALSRGGYLLVETGEYNAAKAAEYFKHTGFIDILIHRDLENQERVVEGRKP